MPWFVTDVANSDGHSRIVLSKALTSSYKVRPASLLRIFLRLTAYLPSTSDYLLRTTWAHSFEQARPQTRGRSGSFSPNCTTPRLRSAKSPCGSWKRRASRRTSSNRSSRCSRRWITLVRWDIR